LKMAKENPHGVPDFQWQNGYGAFSIGGSHVPDVVRCIDGQKAHHQKMNYQDEFRALCRKYGVEWDEQYVWD
jgi:putative transposase